MTDKEKIHQILSSLWKNDDSVGKTYYNQALQDVQTAVDLQEESVSNPIDFEKELYKALGHVKDFTLGMRIAKWFYDMGKKSREPVSWDLGEYINELSKQFPEVSFAKLSRIAVRVAKWQKEQDQSTIELAEDHAMLAGMEKTKEEIMAKGVDGVVHHFEKCGVASVHYNDPTGVPMSYFMSSKGFLEGDKVKVIVIKKE